MTARLTPEAQEEIAKLREVARLALAFGKRFGWGDPGNHEDHHEDCPSSDEDAHRYQEHAKDCERAGERIDLVTKPGTAWPVWPDVSCCDPEDMRDEDAMRKDCDCYSAPLEELVAAARAALSEPR